MIESNTDNIIRKELLDSGNYSNEVCHMSLCDIKAFKEYADEQILKEEQNMRDLSNPERFLEKFEMFGYLAKEMSEFLYEYSEKYYSKVLSKTYPIKNN